MRRPTFSDFLLELWVGRLALAGRDHLGSGNCGKSVGKGMRQVCGGGEVTQARKAWGNRAAAARRDKLIEMS